MIRRIANLLLVEPGCDRCCLLLRHELDAIDGTRFRFST